MLFHSFLDRPYVVRSVPGSQKVCWLVCVEKLIIQLHLKGLELEFLSVAMINDDKTQTFYWSNSAQLESDWSILKINPIVTKYKNIKANQSKLKPLEFVSSLIFL